MGERKSSIAYLLVILLCPSLFSQTADKILKRVESGIRDTKTLYYKATYFSTDPTSEDSIYRSSGEVWLEKVNSDTIFGARFHIKGKEEGKTFDYYYDGESGIEISYSDGIMTIIKASDFPNNSHNPARARMSLDIFPGLLTDNNIISTLLKDNPKIDLESVKGNWLMTFHHPKDENGQITDEILYINRKDYQITGIKKVVKWIGKVFVYDVKLNNYSRNEGVKESDVYLSKSFKDFKRVFVKNSGLKSHEYISPLVGKTAPAFSYASYGGNIITLDQFKGKFVLLDFWETWCGYCLAALPEINKFYEEYKKKGLEVIGVTTENKNKIEELIKLNNLNYPNVFADKKILENYFIAGRPVYVLIDKSGKVLSVTSGDLDSIKRILGKKL